MNKTPNYSLNQWEADDRVLRTDFNADNAAIDAALGALASGKGNCQVVYGQYTGNGLDVKTNPVTLTFEKKPLLVLVSDTSTLIAARGCTRGIRVGSGSSFVNYLTWGENSLSWTVTDNYSAAMNVKGTVYHYVAFLEA